MNDSAEQILNRALESSRGITYELPSPRLAKAEMFRLYRAREKDRKANEAAGLGKASDWDMLQFTTEGQNLIIRKPPSLADIEVKDL